MSLTLREVLAFDALRDAAPELLAGEERLDRPVRWVHSSEIYEISPLLAGGELLLTTGLGLAGSDSGARRHYLREIAQRDVAGVALELGRSFVSVPFELVDEARRLALPLVALHQVVPFTRISESVNTAIVEHRSPALQLAAALERALPDGPSAVLAAAAAHIGAALVLLGPDGALLATHGVPDDTTARTIAARPAATAAVRSGRLAVGSGSVLAAAELDAATHRSAEALAAAPGPGPRTARAALRRLLDAPGVGTAAMALRNAGVPLSRADGRLVGVAAHTAPLGHLCASVDGVVLAVLAVPAGDDPIATAEAVLRRNPGGAVVGPAVELDAPAAALGQSLRTARAAVAVAPPEAVTSARALTLELLLAAQPRPALDAMVAELIGPLVEHDRRHRGRLVHTLEVYLRHGCSPTRAAAVLHLGRQALYQRLERIEALLGHPVGTAEAHAPLVAATAAYRLRAESRENSSA